MAERPDALALLAAAQKVVIDELMPLAGDDGRLPALMVAKALSIAQRELAQPVAERDAAERALLAAALPGRPGATPADLRDALRAGALPPADDRRLREHLLAATRARLEVSNPRLLAALDALYARRGEAP